MIQLNKHIASAEQYCHKQGQRLTKKRKAVLLALLKSQRAISAYALVDYCKTHFNETVTAMSVYRILDFLQQMGLAHKLSLANKYVACAHIVCQHRGEFLQFLICAQCQHVAETNIKRSTSNDLQTAISNTGFHVNMPQLEIHGICDKCFSAEKHRDNKMSTAKN